MRNPKFSLFAVVAYLALVGVMALSTSRPAYTQNGLPPGKDVRVINKDTEPVPVSLQSPNPVPVTLQGTAQIDTSTPIPVQVVNNVPLEPYQAGQFVQMDVGQFSAFAFFPEVPAGKRLVIEMVTAKARVDANERPFLDLTVQSNGSGIKHHIAFTQEAPITDVDLATTQQVRLYADGGTTP